MFKKMTGKLCTNQAFLACIVEEPNNFFNELIKIAVLVTLLFLCTPTMSLAQEASQAPETTQNVTKKSITEKPVADSKSAQPTDSSKASEGINVQSLQMSGGVQSQVIPPSILNTKGTINEPNSASNPGAFMYEYAFQVPPGRNGMTPDLRLSYSSRSIEDQGFGYGWGISIPYIERFNKTGFEALYSTTTPSRSFSSTFSGELTSTSSVDYVARNDDGNNLKYKFVNNSWTVKDKNGIYYEFGTASSSRQEDPGGTGKTYKWMLRKMTDSNGNFIIYSYTRDKGQIYPSSVYYTNHAPTGTGNFFGVNFVLGLRSTTTATSSATGFPVVTRYKVNKVAVLAHSTTTQSYFLNYATGDNKNRLMLRDVTERGQTTASPITLPPTVFKYSTSTTAWSTEALTLPFSPLVSNGTDLGNVSSDVNGDGLVDLLRSRESWDYATGIHIPMKGVYLKVLGGHFTSAAPYTPPCYFSYTIVNNIALNAVQDGGGRLVEINGDGRPDMICGTTGLLNTGAGWATSTLWSMPTTTRLTDINGNKIDSGVRFADINGDGLTDILKAYSQLGTYITRVYINDGSGWNLTSKWTLPSQFDFSISDGSDGGGRAVDVNGDNLTDLFVGKDNAGNATSTVYINTGKGWTKDASWRLPAGLYAHTPGLAFVDSNSDGLVDVTIATGTLTNISDPNTFSWTNNKVYLNTGKGWARDVNRSMPAPFAVNNIETSPRFGNTKGRGLTDVLINALVGNVTFGGFYTVAATTPPDLLKKVIESAGKKISVDYRSTSDYTNNGAPFNPRLPFYYPAVNTVEYFDGINSTSSEYYNYSGGNLYFASSTDRRFAGFDTIYKLDGSGDNEALFFHTGNVSSTTLGEYQDDQTKIGKIYRQEFYDGVGSVYQIQTTKWDKFQKGVGNFVLPIRSTVRTLDGQVASKDSTKEMKYATTSNGNLKQEINWGQVTAINDGSFTDTGTDKIIKNLMYASSSTAPLSKVSRLMTLSQSSTTLSDTKLYYDNLAFGTLGRGNLTMQEDLKSGTTYVKSIRKSYNSFGLVTQDIGARSATTTYIYDSLNLYPATTTNALGHQTSAVYNYDIGQPYVTFDQNRSRTDISYDALNRVRVIQKPNPSYAPAHNTVVEYTYNDTTVPRSIKQTNHFHNSLSVDSYSFYDGFGKLVETRDRAEDANTYKVRVFKYSPDMRRQLSQETDPFFSTGTTYSGTIPNPSLTTSYFYDPLGRIEKTKNAYGDTLYTNSLWRIFVQDPLGNIKRFHKDAYGNLTKVIEKVGTTTATSTYSYDGNNNLTQLTDPLGNVRNFTYDQLGNRLTSQDLHATADTTYGTWQSTYDNRGNITQTISPRAKTTNYTYDLLDRVLTENSTDTTFIDTQYGYDNNSVSPSKGYLTSVSTPSVGTAYTYDIRGNLARESHVIPGFGTSTTMYYYGRQNNSEYVEYDDADVVGYNYNPAGLVNSIHYLKSGNCCWESIIWNLDYSPKDQITTTNGNTTQSLNVYDPQFHYRLTNKSAWNANAYFQNLFYYYDGVGNIVHIDEDANTSAARWMHYTYDDLYRLTSASSSELASGSPFKEVYKYNLLGNLTAKAGVNYLYQGNTSTNYANPHAPTLVGGITTAYDQAGNLLTNGIHTNQYNYKNELTRTITKQGAITATSTYTYNHNGDRLTHTVNGITTYEPNQYLSKTGAVTKKYLYNGPDLIATIDNAGATTIKYITHFDHLGGTNIVTNHQTGNPVQVLDYYPFGSIRVDTSSTTYDSIHKYIGQEYDEESGQSYLNARYLNNSRGQFSSEDPVFWEVGQTPDGRTVLTAPQMQNSYSYAGNSPVTLKDPEGRFAIGFGGDIGGNIPGVYSGGSVHLVMSVTSLSNIEFGIVTSGEGGMTSAVVSGGAGLGGMYSPNARSISDLEGLDIGGGVTGILGPGAGLEGCFGVSVSANTNGSDGRRVKTYKGSLGLGALATPYVVPVSVNGGASYSKSIGKINVSQVRSSVRSAQVKTKSSIQSQLNNVGRQIKKLQKQVNNFKAKLKK